MRDNYAAFKPNKNYEVRKMIDRRLGTNTSGFLNGVNSSRNPATTRHFGPVTQTCPKHKDQVWLGTKASFKMMSSNKCICWLYEEKDMRSKIQIQQDFRQKYLDSVVITLPKDFDNDTKTAICTFVNNISRDVLYDILADAIKSQNLVVLMTLNKDIYMRVRSMKMILLPTINMNAEYYRQKVCSQDDFDDDPDEYFVNLPEEGRRHKTKSINFSYLSPFTITEYALDLFFVGGNMYEVRRHRGDERLHGYINDVWVGDYEDILKVDQGAHLGWKTGYKPLWLNHIVFGLEGAPSFWGQRDEMDVSELENARLAYAAYTGKEPDMTWSKTYIRIMISKMYQIAIGTIPCEPEELMMFATTTSECRREEKIEMTCASKSLITQRNQFDLSFNMLFKRSLPLVAQLKPRQKFSMIYDLDLNTVIDFPRPLTEWLKHPYITVLPITITYDNPKLIDASKPFLTIEPKTRIKTKSASGLKREKKGETVDDLSLQLARDRESIINGLKSRIEFYVNNPKDKESCKLKETQLTLARYETGFMQPYCPPKVSPLLDMYIGDAKLDIPRKGYDPVVLKDDRELVRLSNGRSRINNSKLLDFVGSFKQVKDLLKRHPRPMETVLKSIAATSIVVDTEDFCSPKISSIALAPELPLLERPKVSSPPVPKPHVSLDSLPEKKLFSKPNPTHNPFTDKNNPYTVLSGESESELGFSTVKRRADMSYQPSHLRKQKISRDQYKFRPVEKEKGKDKPPEPKVSVPAGKVEVQLSAGVYQAQILASSKSPYTRQFYFASITNRKSDIKQPDIRPEDDETVTRRGSRSDAGMVNRERVLNAKMAMAIEFAKRTIDNRTPEKDREFIASMTKNQVLDYVREVVNDIDNVRKTIIMGMSLKETLVRVTDQVIRNTSNETLKTLLCTLVNQSWVADLSACGDVELNPGPKISDFVFTKNSGTYTQNYRAVLQRVRGMASFQGAEALNVDAALTATHRTQTAYGGGVGLAQLPTPQALLMPNANSVVGLAANRGNALPISFIDVQVDETGEEGPGQNHAEVAKISQDDLANPPYRQQSMVSGYSIRDHYLAMRARTVGNVNLTAGILKLKLMCYNRGPVDTPENLFPHQNEGSKWFADFWPYSQYVWQGNSTPNNLTNNGGNAYPVDEDALNDPNNNEANMFSPLTQNFQNVRGNLIIAYQNEDVPNSFTKIYMPLDWSTDVNSQMFFVFTVAMFAPYPFCNNSFWIGVANRSDPNFEMFTASTVVNSGTTNIAIILPRTFNRVDYNNVAQLNAATPSIPFFGPENTIGTFNNANAVPIPAGSITQISSIVWPNANPTGTWYYSLAAYLASWRSIFTRNNVMNYLMRLSHYRPVQQYLIAAQDIIAQLMPIPAPMTTQNNGQYHTNATSWDEQDNITWAANTCHGFAKTNAYIGAGATAENWPGGEITPTMVIGDMNAETWNRIILRQTVDASSAPDEVYMPDFETSPTVFAEMMLQTEQHAAAWTVVHAATSLSPNIMSKQYAGGGGDRWGPQYVPQFKRMADALTTKKKTRCNWNGMQIASLAENAYCKLTNFKLPQVNALLTTYDLLSLPVNGFVSIDNNGYLINDVNVLGQTIPWQRIVRHIVEIPEPMVTPDNVNMTTEYPRVSKSSGVGRIFTLPNNFVYQTAPIHSDDWVQSPVQGTWFKTDPDEFMWNRRLMLLNLDNGIPAFFRVTANHQVVQPNTKQAMRQIPPEGFYQYQAQPCGYLHEFTDARVFYSNALAQLSGSVIIEAIDQGAPGYGQALSGLGMYPDITFAISLKGNITVLDLGTGTVIPELANKINALVTGDAIRPQIQEAPQKQTAPAVKAITTNDAAVQNNQLAVGVDDPPKAAVPADPVMNGK
jgi:hypothetical protein